VNKKIVIIVSVLLAIGLTTLLIIKDEPERARPDGKESIVGQPAPAPAPATAPAAAPAPAAEAVPAAAPAAASSGAAIDGEAIYKTACFACHDGQLPMSPKLGDKEKWAPRIEKGIEALYQSAFNGVSGTPMPPRGNCPTCSDEDLKAAVDFMVSKAK
jgi:cytochrome c5